MARALPTLAGVAVLLLATAASGERIRSFESEVHLEGDDSFRIVERIRYDFETERRRGIYRDIPVRYGRGRAADYRIEVEVEGVTDAGGASRPYKVMRKGAYLRIRIGDPDVYLTGPQDYWISYRVRRGILWFDDHDELYWNATGTEWEVPIDEARAFVRLPEGTGEGLEYRCFTGRHGSVSSDCSMSVQGNLLLFTGERPFGVREGLTFVVGLRKGVLVEPSPLDRSLDRASDYLSAWLLLPLLALAGMWRTWHTSGRDPQGREAIPVRYEPPEGLLPAEVGTLVDERADIEDITATILNLAVKGHLEIEEVESEGFLFFSNRDYLLRKVRDLPATARPHERALFDALFASEDEVTVSSLKNKFYEKLPGIRDALYRQLSRGERYFAGSPQMVRRVWALGGGALLGVGAVTFATELLDVAIAIGGCGLIVLLFSRSMPRRTRKGRRAYEEILGFKEFAQRVDKDRLERMGGRTRDRFEAVLPYALVLGVADQWADAFADLYTQPPSWYHSSRYTDGFVPRIFVNDLGQSLRTMGETLKSQPRGSGTSGFSSGGGFSGGGFGGGGGGSW